MKSSVAAVHTNHRKQKVACLYSDTFADSLHFGICANEGCGLDRPDRTTEASFLGRHGRGCIHLDGGFHTNEFDHVNGCFTSRSLNSNQRISEKFYEHLRIRPQEKDQPISYAFLTCIYTVCGTPPKKK